MQKNNCFIIFGPTASGKTAFSSRLAELVGKDDVVILNADSMQMFKGLPILTAAPEAKEYQGIEHHLFEYLDPDFPNSVVSWWGDIVEHMDRAFTQGKTVIVVGGTGLYLKSLIKGMPATPHRNDEWFERAHQELDRLGHDAFFEALKKDDPLIEGHVLPEDTQRMIRAYGVFHATGRSLIEWQKDPAKPVPFELDFHYHQIIPNREWLYDRCNRRFDLMVEAGALREIESFIKYHDGDTFDLCRKVIGFDELKSYQRQEISLDEARVKAAQRTRRYAKRQMTWARGQMAQPLLAPFVKTWHEWDEKTLGKDALSSIERQL